MTRLAQAAGITEKHLLCRFRPPLREVEGPWTCTLIWGVSEFEFDNRFPVGVGMGWKERIDSRWGVQLEGYRLRFKLNAPARKDTDALPLMTMASVVKLFDVDG